MIIMFDVNINIIVINTHVNNGIWGVELQGSGAPGLQGSRAPGLHCIYIYIYIHTYIHTYIHNMYRYI